MYPSFVDRAVLQRKDSLRKKVAPMAYSSSQGKRIFATNDEIVDFYKTLRVVYPDRFIVKNFLSDSDSSCNQYLPDDADVIWTDFGVDSEAE